MAPTATAEPAPLPEVAMPEAFPRHRLTVERYLRMVDSGAFDSKEPIFLWEGALVEKMTKGRPHGVAAMVLNYILDRMLPITFYVEHEQPIRLDDQSMPEPDLSVIRGPITDYLEEPPGAGDLAIIIEVSDSSLRLDSTIVKRAYARCSIPEYWIVNVPGRCVEVHREPSGPAEAPDYRSSTTHGVDRTIPVILDGREVGQVRVADLFPGPPPG